MLHCQCGCSLRGKTQTGKSGGARGAGLLRQLGLPKGDGDNHSVLSADTSDNTRRSGLVPWRSVSSPESTILRGRCFPKESTLWAHCSNRPQSSFRNVVEGIEMALTALGISTEDIVAGTLTSSFVYSRWQETAQYGTCAAMTMALTLFAGMKYA